MKPAACFVSSSCSRFRWLLVPSASGQGTWSAGAESPERQTVSLTHPMQALILSADFLLHMPCWFHFYPGNFSYTSRAGFIFMRGVSSTHPMPTVFLCGELRSLTHPMLPSFLCGEFLLHIPCCLDFLEGVSLTPPCCLFFFFFFFFFKSGEFLLHIMCCLDFYARSFSLTHPMLESIWPREFLLHIPCWLNI